MSLGFQPNPHPHPHPHSTPHPYGHPTPAFSWVLGSIADVASSSSNTAGCRSTIRARQTSCRSPKLRLLPGGYCVPSYCGWSQQKIQTNMFWCTKIPKFSQTSQWRSKNHSGYGSTPKKPWKNVPQLVGPPPSSLIWCSNFLGNAATISARPATRSAWTKRWGRWGLGFWPGKSRVKWW